MVTQSYWVENVSVAVVTGSLWNIASFVVGVANRPSYVKQGNRVSDGREGKKKGEPAAGKKRMRRGNQKLVLWRQKWHWMMAAGQCLQMQFPTHSSGDIRTTEREIQIHVLNVKTKNITMHNS